MQEIALHLSFQLYRCRFRGVYRTEALYISLNIYSIDYSYYSVQCACWFVYFWKVDKYPFGQGLCILADMKNIIFFAPFIIKLDLNVNWLSCYLFGNFHSETMNN